jgi:hypothetical protein
VVPVAHHAHKTHQDVEQQRRPDLPTDRVGAVAQEIAQLQALLDLFEEHFDLPPAAIQIGHTAGTPTEVVGQKLHLALLAVDPPPGLAPAASACDNWLESLCFEHHKFVAQDAFIGCLGQFFNDPKTERFFAAGHPKDPILIERTQVHEINLGAVKDHDLTGFNARADFCGPNAIACLG